MTLEYDESTPLITVGITSYNAARTIDRALKSAIAQDWRNLEIIIVDDCSVDNTLSFIPAPSCLDEKINLKVLVNATNKGVAYSRNKIIENANGAYLAFFDDDDESSNDRLTKQYQSLKEVENIFGPSILAISHVGRRIIYNGKVSVYQKPICVDKFCFGGVVAQHFLVGFGLANSGSISTCAQMASLSTYKSLNGFDDSFRRSEDSDFIIRAAFSNAIFTGVDLPLVNQHMTKKDKSIDTENFYHTRLIEKHKNYLMERSFYEFVTRWADLKFSYFKNEPYFLKFVIIIILHPILFFKRFFTKRINWRINRSFFDWHNYQ